MKPSIYCCLLSLIVCSAYSQNPLKSVRFAKVQILTDISKEKLIDGINFHDVADNQSDVVRLDFVLPNSKPLVVSCKKTVQSDSLGAYLLTVSKQTLASLLDRIHRCNSKATSRAVDYVLLRVTYRYNGDVFQYYQSNEKIVTAYLRSIFDEELRNEPKEALESFYEFVRPASLDRLKEF
jgi:hypothetical protein